MNTRELLKDHILEIERRALGGDTHAIKTLAAMVLLIGDGGYDPRS